jgi:cytochrome c-type biogenesis protein CcmF
MANFGNFCLLFALCLTVYACIAALIGASQKQYRIVQSAERAALAASGCIGLAFFALLFLLLKDDFGTAHVASNSSRALHWLFKISAIWGGHDGSMLLWVFFTAILVVMVIYQNRNRYRDMMPYVIAVLMFDLSFFLSLNLFLSNPFQQLTQKLSDGTIQKFLPPDGNGLNPLLHHWAMVIHPPILYFGFIGFLIPFAFAIAALVTRQQGDTWVRIIRGWTLWTWLLLGIGIILGGKWAYEVLGWGGYWGWDPVENVSLMPWLVSTAFLHSVIVQERRGMLKIWNTLLITITYLLGIFGTFLARSGIVNSVHAFNDANIGKFFEYYMAFVLCASVFLIIYRRSYLKSERSLDSLVSRESAFLFNNLVLVVSCFAVFWGTMFPVISEWFRGTKISVDSVWFNKVNVPIGLLLLFLTGIGPLFAWRKTSLGSLKKAFLWPVIIAAVACVGLLLGGMRHFYVLVCLTLSAFVLATIFQEFFKGAQIRVRSKGESFPAALLNLTLKNKRRYGGYIVHFAVVLMFIGFAGNAFNRETIMHLKTGQEAKIGDYSLKLVEFREGQTPTYQYGQTVLEAYKDGKLVHTLRPEQRIFNAGQQSTTTVGLYSTPKEDLYVVFTGMSPDSTCEIKAHVNPLVFWVWFGFGLMIVGTLIAIKK